MLRPFAMCFGVLVVMTYATTLAAKETKPGIERWPVKTSTAAEADPQEVALGTLLALPDEPGVNIYSWI